jgi:hypothetical protein
VAQVVDVAPATPGRSRRSEMPIAIGQGREMRMREPFEAWCKCVLMRRRT